MTAVTRSSTPDVPFRYAPAALKTGTGHFYRGEADDGDAVLQFLAREANAPMFTRLRETIRIITYRTPQTHGPDAVIIEVKEVPPSRISKAIATGIEGMIVCTVIGYALGWLGDAILRLQPHKTTASIFTLVGALGALLFWLFHGLINQIQAVLHKHFSFADKLAPYFGHRIESTYRILKG